MHTPRWAVAVFGLAGFTAGAQEHAAPDKGSYTLFAPTPRDLMRDMSTDRPDATESPYTVDAGHVQVEMSLFEYALDSGSVETISVAPLNVKVGLLNSTDLQLVFTPWIHEDTEDGPLVSGVGDTQARLKINLWGNDGGPSALALMPFMSFPTGRDDLSSGHLEGGLILPLALELPRGLGLGLMAELDFLYDRDTAAYQTDFVHTAVLGADLAGSLGGFVEYVGAENLTTSDGYRASFNTGLTYGVGPNMQWDLGVGVGLTDAAEDFTAFVGLSVRY